MVIQLPCAADPHALLMLLGTEMGTDTPGDLNVRGLRPGQDAPALIQPLATGPTELAQPGHRAAELSNPAVSHPDVGDLAAVTLLTIARASHTQLSAIIRGHWGIDDRLAGSATTRGQAGV
jgi:hypothetical protein